MRILMWPSSFPPSIGGVEKMVSSLVRSLRQRGHEVLVVTQAIPDAKPPEDPQVLRLPFYEAIVSRDLDLMDRLRREVVAVRRELRPHLAHIHSLHPSLFLYERTAHHAPCPALLTLHGRTPGADQPTSLVGRIVRSADRVVACSRWVLEAAHSDAPEIASRSEVLYNGLEAGPEPVRNLPPGPPKLLGLGRLERRKGFDRVVRMLPFVLEHHPEAHLTIVGDGPQRAELESLARQLSVLEHVTFTGTVPPGEVASWLDRSHLLVTAPFVREGFSLVAVEAALRARPVVATRNGGLAETVKHGVTGLLVENGPLEELVAAVLEIVGDRSLAERMGRQGRNRALELFDWEQYVDRTLEIYAQVAKEKP